MGTKNTIYIGSPYIVKEGSFVRLCSDIDRPSGAFTLYFEVPKDYEKYLCSERINSFVLGILEYAMYTDSDICSDSMIDEDLYYSLTNYGPNIISDNIKFLHNIKINAPFSSKKIENENAVGTGFSAGVDSFYTVLKHLNPEERSYKLTHLLIANVGAFTYARTEETQKLFYQQVDVLSHAAGELGLPLISVNSNFNDFYLDILAEESYVDYMYSGTPLKIAACVYAMQKLFSIYFIASSFQLKLFHFSQREHGFALDYYIKLFSTRSLMFYDSGVEVARIEKVEYICKNDIVKKYLSIDVYGNCSRCEKCLRTLIELYLLDALEGYEEVFDIADFKAHLSSRIGEYLSFRVEYEDGFAQEIIAMFKRNGIRIPLSAYIKSWLVYRPYNFIKHILRKSKFIRKIYYQYNIDVKIYGSYALARRDSYRAAYNTKERREKPE